MIYFFKFDYAHIPTHMQKINNSDFAHALNQSSSVKRGQIRLKSTFLMSRKFRTSSELITENG